MSRPSISIEERVSRALCFPFVIPAQREMEEKEDEETARKRKRTRRIGGRRGAKGEWREPSSEAENLLNDS